MPKAGRGVPGTIAERLKGHVETYCAWARTLATAPRFPHVERLVRRLVYLWCLFSVLALLPAANELWGPGSYLPPVAETERQGVLLNLDLLSKPAIAHHYHLVVGAYVAFLLLGLLEVFPRLSALMSFALMHVLSLRAYAVTDGGDNLMSQMLFYLGLSVWVGSPGSASSNVARNLALLSLRVQLCVVYATAGLSKWGGELWPRGEAIYYVLQADEYTLPWFRDWIGNSGLLLACATYAVVFFQISFSFLIWREPTRRLMMVIGMLMHLQIALVMGLFSFGLAMIVSYAVFYTDAEAKHLLDAWQERRLQITNYLGALRRKASVTSGEESESS